MVGLWKLDHHLALLKVLIGETTKLPCLLLTKLILPEKVVKDIEIKKMWVLEQ
jgi:hypothetical protein